SGLRPSARRSVVQDGSCLFLLGGHVVHDGLHVFVAAARQAHDHQVVLGQLRCALDRLGQGMGAFQGRDDAFQAAGGVERIQRLVIGDADVFHALHFVQVGVLRADARVVEACGNRVGVGNLTVFVLQQVGTVAVQHARYPAV